MIPVGEPGSVARRDLSRAAASWDERVESLNTPTSSKTERGLRADVEFVSCNPDSQRCRTASRGT